MERKILQNGKKDRRFVSTIILMVVFQILFLLVNFVFAQTKTTSTVENDIKSILQYYDKQIYFTQNKGQWPEHVLYKADFPVGQALATKEGMLIGAFDPHSVSARHEQNMRAEKAQHDHIPFNEPLVNLKGHGWLMNFLNSSSSMSIDGKSKHADEFNYFTGDAAQQATGVASFQEIWYNDVYRNVDVRYYPSSEGTLEYDIICKPGFDKKAIAIQFEGIDKMKVDEKGHLVLTTSVGDLDFPNPVAYQMVNGKQKLVKIKYVVNKNVLSFEVGQYDNNLPLVIDPIALRWATWLTNASTGADHGHGIWVDQTDGSIYIVARVDGSGLITVNAFDATANGGIDLIVGKYTEPATIGGPGVRVWQTYIGGSSDDNPYAMEQGPDGNLYITGYTASTNYPLLGGTAFSGASIDQRSQNNDNIFVTKINTAGNSIKSSVIGGNQNDGSFDLRINNAGDIVVCGNTQSTNLATLYAGSGASNTNNGGTDVLVFKIKQDLSSIVWMKNYGGSSTDQATIMLQNTANGDIFVGGYTASNNFPVLSPRQSTLGGSQSGFLQKLSAAGSTIWSSYYQSASGKSTSILCMEFNTLKNQIYFGGITGGLAASNMPAGGYQNTYGGGTNDFFVSRLDTGQLNILSTYLGGSANEVNMMGLNVDLNNDAYIFGYTNSTNFPVTSDALQATNLGNNDKTFVKLANNLATLKFSTYYGGSADDYDPVGERGIKFSNCRIYTIVTSESNNIPLTQGAITTTKLSSTSIYEPGLVVWANPPDLTGNTVTGNQEVCKNNLSSNMTGSVPSYSLPTIIRNGTTSAYPNITAVITYQWQISTDSINWTNIPGGTTQNLNGSQIGPISQTTYLRRIINGDACVISGAVGQIITLKVLNITGTITNANCFGQNNGSITTSVTNGTPPYTYAWNPGGATTASVSNLIGGTYRVIVSDASGCRDTAFFTVNQPTSLITAASSNNGPITCTTTTRTISVNNCDGAANRSYAWTGPGGFTSSQQCPLVSAAGTYTVTVTNTVNGCTGTSSTTVILDNASPAANCGNSGAITCTNPTRTVSVNNCDGAANRSYAWTGPGGFTSTQQCPSVSADGIYTVTVTNTINGCTATCSTTVILNNASPAANCSNNGAITCTNITRTVSVNNCDGAANRSYAWTGPGGFTSTQQCPVVSAAGSYTVTVTNTISGCTATCSTTILLDNASPVANCSNNGAITCSNITRTVSVNNCDGAANRSYAWTGPGGFTSALQCPIVNAAGTYTVTVTNTISGCTATCSTTILLDNTLPAANCSNNGAITCSDITRTVSVNNCDGAANRSYAWTGPGGFTSTQQCPVVNAAGTYTVTVTNTISGCTATCSTTILLNNTLPVANCSNNGAITCTNITRTVSVNNCDGAANRSYAWTGPGGFTSTQQCPSVSAGGTYTVTVTNTISGCTATCSTTILLDSNLPVANCSNNGAITCTNIARTVSVNNCDGAANRSYAWTGPAGFTSTQQCATVNAAGVYTVTVTNTTSGCTATCSTTILLDNTSPAANCSNNGAITCSNIARTVSVNSCDGAANRSYAWTGPAGFSSTQQCPSVSAAGVYTVTVTNTISGCTATCSTTILLDNTSPVANCSNNGAITCSNITRTVSVNNCDGAANRSYAWTGPGGFTSAQQCPSVSAAGVYIVTVTNTISGCTATCSTTILLDNTLPAANCSNNGAITCSNITRTVSVNNCDGAANRSYAWTGPGGFTSTQQCPIVSAAGTYTVTVTNTISGCTATCSTTILLDNTLPAANCSNNGAITCSNITRTVSVNSCDGAANRSYAWTGPGGFTSTQQCPIVSAAGTYTVTVTNTISGCSATCSTTILLDNSSPVANCSNSGVLTCSNTTRTVSVNNCDGASNRSYAWTGPGGFTSTQQCPVVSAAGIYTVTVTNTISGCTATCSITLTQDIASPLASCSNSGIITCANTTRTLSVNNCDAAANRSYAWTGPAGFISTQQCPTVTAPGTYIVTVTNTINGCTATCSTTLTQDITSPVASCSNSGTITCANTTRTLSVNNCDAAADRSYAWTGPAGFTSTQQCPIVSAPGTYIVTVTNTINGCTATCSTTLIQDIASPLANCSNSGAITCANITRTISVNDCDGAANTTYSWTGPAGFTSTQQCPTVSAAGVYIVTVTNTINGCTASCSTSVTLDIASPVANCSNSGPITCSHTTSTISVNNCDSAANTTYSWTGPAGFTSTQPCPIVSAPGLYAVTVTNTVNGCTTTSSTTVIQDIAVPAANCSNDGILNCVHSTRIVSVNNCDGATDRSYIWTGPAGFTSTQQCATVDTSGIYTVTITNTVSGCTSTCSTTMSQNTEHPRANCGNNGPITCAHPICIVNVDSCDGAPNTAYLWTGPGGFSSTQQCPSVNAPGEYSVTVTNTMNECTNTCSTTISTDLTPPEVNCTNSGSLTCTHTTSIVSVNNCDGAANRSYAWTGPGGFTSTQQCPTVNIQGTYMVTVTNTINGCTTTSSTTLIQDITPPAASCSSNGPITCPNSTRTVSVNNCDGAANTAYSWTAPGGFTSTEQCPLVSVAGVYTATVTNTINGCMTTDSVTLTALPPIVTIAQSIDSVACYGNATGVVTLSATGGSGPYLFADSSFNFQSSPVFSGLTAGAHIFYTSDDNGCLDSLIATVNEPSSALSVIATHTNVSCNGGATGTVTANPSGGTGIYSYAWNTSPAQTTQTVTGLSIGIYTVVVTDQYGCGTTASTTINQSSPIDVTAITAIQPACHGDANGSLTATVTGGNGPYTYLWSNNQTTNPATGLTAGSYSVTIFDLFNCSITSNSFTLSEPTMLDASNYSSTDASCSGGANGTATIIPSGGTPNYTYLWNDPGHQTTQTATGLLAGTYAVTITDANLCNSTANVTVGQAAPLNVYAGTDQYICGDSAILAAQLPQGPQYSGIWSGSATFADPTNPITGVTGLSIGNNILTWSVTDNTPGAQCPPVPMSVNIHTDAPAVADAGNDLNACVNLTTHFDLNGQPAFQGSGFWTLVSGAGWITDPTSYNTTFFPITAPSRNLLVWTVTNGACHAQDTVTLDYHQGGDCYELELPTAYSPNGDGHNDAYVIHGLESFPENTFEVFNRWGNKVYSKDNYENHGPYDADWRGQNKNGDNLPDGTYFVIFTIPKFNIQKHTYVDLRR